MNLPSDHDIIVAGLTIGTGTYMARWIFTDLIVGLFEIIETFKTQREKVKNTPNPPNPLL